MRLISLLSSSTETVCALGFEEFLVGRSHECDYPASVKSLPVCSEPRINPEVPSAEIHNDIQSLLQQSLSIYQVDAEIIKELKPDVILTQDHCRVCAVSLEDVQTALCDFTDSKAEIVTLHPNSLEEVWNDMVRISNALGAKEHGQAFVTNLKTEMEIIKASTNGLPKPKVACFEWIDPVMLCGSWLPELIEIAGGEAILSHADEPAKIRSWEEVEEADPDILVFSPCGFDAMRTEQEVKALKDRTEYMELRAVRNGHVYIIDGNQYMNRPGPRIVESARMLASYFHGI